MLYDFGEACSVLYRELERVEGDLAAAAYRETHTSPFKAGVSVQHHNELRALLAKY